MIKLWVIRFKYIFLIFYNYLIDFKKISNKQFCVFFSAKYTNKWKIRFIIKSHKDVVREINLVVRWVPKRSLKIFINITNRISSYKLMKKITIIFYKKQFKYQKIHKK